MKNSISGEGDITVLKTMTIDDLVDQIGGIRAVNLIREAIRAIKCFREIADELHTIAYDIYDLQINVEIVGECTYLHVYKISSLQLVGELFYDDDLPTLSEYTMLISLDK